MPLLSYGTKGPAGVRGISGWICTKCGRVLSRRDALRDHSLRKHGWCIDTNAPATEEALKALKSKTQRRKSSAPDPDPDESKLKINRKEVHGLTPSQPWICSTCDKTFTEEALLTEHCIQVHGSAQFRTAKHQVFGETCISDISSDSESTDRPDETSKPHEQEDVEPDYPLPIHPETSSCQSPTEKKLTGQVKRSTLTNWSAIPTPVAETANPCERKKFQMKITPCPVKRLTAQAEPKAVKIPHPSTSVVSTDESTSQALLKCTEAWPARGILPSVRDIVAFRKTVPHDTTPFEIGQLAGAKFGWAETKNLTSERYVQVVVAGYDQARRVLLDELLNYLNTKPTSATDALQRWGSLVEWFQAQPRPPTPKQAFED